MVAGASGAPFEEGGEGSVPGDADRAETLGIGRAEVGCDAREGFVLARRGGPAGGEAAPSSQSCRPWRPDRGLGRRRARRLRLGPRCGAVCARDRALRIYKS